MIKECKIILRNKEVIVVDFDGVCVQMPNKSNNNYDSVYIKYKDGKYSFATEDEYKKYKTQIKKKFDITEIKTNEN